MTELRTLRTEDGKVETVRVHPLVPRWPEEYVDGQYAISSEVRRSWVRSSYSFMCKCMIMIYAAYCMIRYFCMIFNLLHSIWNDIKHWD